jgi:hypothetical protein
MLKRLKVSVFAAALTGVSLLAMGCSLGSGNFLGAFYNTNTSSWTRILAAILREDLFS